MTVCSAPEVTDLNATKALSSIAILIPTYNRRDILRRTLDGYLAQSNAGVIHELIVVDDGSTDATGAVVEEARANAPFPVRYLRQSNQGPSAARNRAIEQATAPLLLLTDDDMVPHRELVGRHVEWHQNHPLTTAAVLGRVKWAQELGPTPFMQWYGNFGPLFAYGIFGGQRRIDFRYMYSCNLSFKSEFIKSVKAFDERFKMAAFEDMELGFRLTKAGMQLYYEPEAVTFHHQRFTFAQACSKTRKAEAAKQTFFETEAGKEFLALRSGPDTRPGLRVARSLAAHLFRPLASRLDSNLPLPKIVYRSLFWYYAVRPAVIQPAHRSSKLQQHQPRVGTRK